VCLFRGREVPQDEVLRRADLAMYRSKAAGRGTLHFFDPLMQAALDDQVALSRDLQQALAGGQLSLHFQRQIDGELGTVGAELLLRWQHPTRGVLLPEQFIPLAEQNGLILPIGQWVVASACSQLARWAADPASRHLQLAVNISARQFLRPGFAESVTSALKDHGADPALLRLELRQRLVEEHPAAAMATMGALHAAGVGFAMDDFGISASSISHLRRLPLDQIKISRSLMPTLTSDAHDAAIVRTIIGMANGLGLSILAAGVETEQQRDRLREMGCHLWQGFLFGAPVPLADFEHQLHAWPPSMALPLQHPMPSMPMG
jgi:EAL domain-containing protein (putative c-di-GMP-specific phosphodiesterase class I)